MRMTIVKAGLYTLCLLTSTCIEPYDPPVSGYENLLVVQGFISDQVEPYTVQLSRTYPIDSGAVTPVTGAYVTVVDGEEREYLFAELGGGIYASDPAVFVGEVGQTYRLKVRTTKNEEIESLPVTLLVAPPIDSLYWRYEPRFTSTSSEPVPGIQVYLSTHDPTNQTRYYRWEWVETWEFTVPLYSSYEIVNGRIDGRQENISRCWRSQASAEILSGTTINLSEDRISQQPLRYVSTDNSRLGIQYSLEARQFALSEAAYNFWASLFKINQGLGTLFDPQPAPVLGNLVNTGNPGTPVLGYFDASTITTGRIFIRRQELPEGVRVDRGYRNCFADTVLLEDVFFQASQGFNLLGQVLDMSGFLYAYTMGSVPCSDCRLNGTNAKPDFWP